MRISAKADYAVRAAIELANAPDGPTKGEAVGRAQGIPLKFLENILGDLRHAGIVRSQRGARGGYRLARPLSAIPITDVVAAIDGPIALTACVEGSGTGCEAECLCPVRGRWDLVNDAVRQALGRITLADMDRSTPRASQARATAQPEDLAFNLISAE